MKKIFNQDNLKSLQGQLGSFSATVKWPNMPSLTAATTPASAPSTSEPPSQLLSRQASITGGDSHEIEGLKARIEHLQELEDELPKLRALNETLKAKLHEAEKNLTNKQKTSQSDERDNTMELTVSSLKSALQAAEEKNASLLSAAQAPDSSLNGSNVHEAQIEALKAELSFLSSSKTSLEIELKVAKSTIASHTARLLEMAENQAKAEDVLQRYEQLCEDLEESRERAEAAELSLYEATKALELLQGDLSAQAKSMIESQEAYEELREKLEHHSSYKSEMEAKVASAEKRAAEAEAKLTSLLPPPSTPSLPLSSPPATPLPSSTAPTADQPVKVKTQPSPSPSPSLTALGDSPGGYLRQALQEVTAEVATLRANMVTRSTSAGGGAGLGAGLGAEGEERVLLEKLMEDLHATEAALKEMKLQLDEAREEVLVLKGEGSVNSNTNSNSNPQPPPSPSQTQTLIDVSASIPRFFAQIRASHGGLKKLAERIDEMEELAEMAASLVSLPPTAALRDKTEEGGGWQQKYEDLKLALAHHQSSQDESVASLTRQLSEARSEASGHKDHALRLEADCSRLQADIEEKDRAIKSLEDQVEDLGKSLSKINAQYQRQFARIEADQSSVIESVKGEARAQVEAAKQEAQAQVAAIKSEAQAQLAAAKAQSSAEADALRSAAKRNEEERDERLDRLHNLHRKQAAEKDAMAAELTSCHSKIASLDAQDKESKQAISALKTKVAAMEPLMSELEVLKKKLQEASATASKYDKAEKERLELSKKVQLLEAQAAESKMLRDELLKLSNVNIELQTVKTRLTAAEEARDRALGDASRSSLMLSNLEGRLEQVEEDNESLSTALEQLRRRAAAQTTHHPPSLTVNTSSSSNSSKGGAPPLPSLEEHIRGIMSVVEGAQGTLLPRDQWPTPLIRLMQELEAASKAEAVMMMRSSNSPDRKTDKRTCADAAVVLSSSPDEGMIVDPLASDSREELREDHGSSSSLEEALKMRSNRGSLSDNRLLMSERKVVDLTLQVEALRLRLEGEVERAREAEEEARVRFESARASWIKEAEEEAAQYSSELNRLQGLLSESKSMRDRAFGLEEQLMAMRDKSRLMLEEKEREVEALQATIRQLQLMHGAGQLPNQQQQGVNTTGGGGVKGVMSNLVSPSNSFTSSVEQQLKSKIVGLERELRDSEKTHELRSIAEQALKDELSSTRAVLQMASSGDNSYMALRAAIVSGLEQGMFVSKPGHMFTMLSRMLQLSPQEIKRVEAGASKAK